MSLSHAIKMLALERGFDVVRTRGLRYPAGRRARLMAALGIDLVVDVGANRGQFGQEVRRSGYTGDIVSVEPLAEPFLALTRLAERDGRWTAIQSAVGAESGSATIHVAANGGASSSLLPMLSLHERSAPEARYVTDERVNVATLDDLVAVQVAAAKAVFTKMDVQGYERHVLSGAETTLARSTLVQIELSLVPLYEMAPTYREILDFMVQRGFRLVGVEPGFASPNGLLLQFDGLFANAAAAESLQTAPIR